MTARAQPQQRTRRLRILTGVVVLAIAMTAVAIAVSIGGHEGGLAQGARARQIVTQVDSLLAGIPEHGTVLGRPDAKVTLTFFGDLQCPVCAAFATGQDLAGVAGGLPRFIRRQVRTGWARVFYRSFCTATCNDFGPRLFDQQQSAAYAAGEQNRFWFYEELFYRQQGIEGSPYVTPRFLTRLAEQTPGLNLKTWTDDRRDPSLLSKIQHDAQAANNELPLVNGGRGTPGLIISGPRGTRFVGEGIVTYDQLESGMNAVR